MTKAERLREVTEQAIENKRLANIDKNRKYASRLVSGKCHRRALKGYNSCEVKIPRWYTPSLVIEEVERMGFEVKRNSKNGRTVLVIKW